MTANEVLTALRNELVDAGIVRKPSTAGGAPPAFVEPLGGAPAPGDREGVENDPTLMVTLSLSGEVAVSAAESYVRPVVIDVRYRSRTTAGLQRGRIVDDAIRHALVDRADLGQGFTLDPLGSPVYVLRAAIFGGLSRIEATAERGYDELAKYLLEVYA